MSRILIHSNAPWVPSGYGKQCAHLVRILQQLGHEVVVSAFSGLTGSPIEWQGTTVLPSGMYEYGMDVLIPHMDAVEPDLTVALMDVWKLGPIAEALTGRRMAAWVPVDCSPLSRLDNAFFQTSGVRPIAMSRFGQDELKAAGLDPLYAPHVVDREIFKPLSADDRTKYRAALGVEGRFVIGLCAANNDATRKAFPEQFEAFRQFHKHHPEAFLWVHAVAKNPRGLDLNRLAHEIGIDPSAIRIGDTYAQVAGVLDDSFMADWYGVLDVLSLCSYAEAFGVPLIEAQACGTPVVTTAGSAMMENRGAGWMAQSEPFWNHVHGAWWDRPKIESIARQYAKALVQSSTRNTAAVNFADGFGMEAGRAAWESIVESMCG